MSIVKELLLVQSFNLSSLIEEYRLFFLSLIPSVFILAVIIEYLDRLEPFSLVKRTFISVLILTTVTSFYEQSINSSMDTADQVLKEQKSQNILLMDFFEGISHRNVLSENDEKDFFKDQNFLTGTMAFIKHHLFDSFVNDGFTITIYFITKLCFIILKVVYSLVYYLGYGLMGIPCLIYLFPSMGNVLRGAILSYLWCLIVPHVLVFIISMIGTEINNGYVSGNIIGGSMMGTAFLFILTLFIAFTPLIGAMILNGSGISQAGGIIATIGANYVMNLPKATTNNFAAALTGERLGPKTRLASNAVGKSYKLAKGTKNIFSSQKNSTDNSAITNSSLENKPNDVNNKRYQKINNDLPNSTNKTIQQSSNQLQKTMKGEKNGTIHKYGPINRSYQKTPNIYRTPRLSNTYSNFRSRDISRTTKK